MIDPDEIVEFNGQSMAIKDVPDKHIRAMLGYGHGYTGRPVVEGEWAYTPDTCLLTGPTEGTKWINDNQTLVCTGCGLDVT